MKNHLKNQTSPYLIQHADNPVDWYPWCQEAFERAKAEDKPIFLSIGYSTCHWCHVMAHESFEDTEIAQILNEHFISIKVDKEGRPDIDSSYMSVCQAFTGSGGWPTTVFLTPEQKPFYAGTYYPKTAKYGRIGLKELLLAIHEKWKKDRRTLLESAEEMIQLLKDEGGLHNKEAVHQIDNTLITTAFQLYKRSFDSTFGGFGEAPKFPTPHNLLFLMKYYEKSQDTFALDMVEKTLLQMYRGGIFDHIGGGFSRYSTDRYFLVPHFEKMLYDNALLILAYSKVYELTKKPIYQKAAKETANYILWEMTSPAGGFYSAQDADSEGVEGKYYLLEPEEIVELLGQQEGNEFNEVYDITKEGNFEGKNIPNLLCKSYRNVSTDNEANLNDKEFSHQQLEQYKQTIYQYRKNRYGLHLDDKILTSWNGLMIAAMCYLYRITGDDTYLDAAKKAQDFIEGNLCEGDTLHISYRNGKCSGKGFLDDYANEIFALLALYKATFQGKYLDRAKKFCQKALVEFYDEKQGGFFLYGEENEQLILRPKETYDGAIFSGNSAMAYNLVQLSYLTGDAHYEELAGQQLAFISKEASHYPAGYAMFLVALSDYLEMPEKITVVLKDKEDLKGLSCRISLDAIVNVLEQPTAEYPLKDYKTTFYICKGQSCLPPVNHMALH